MNHECGSETQRVSLTKINVAKTDTIRFSFFRVGSRPSLVRSGAQKQPENAPETSVPETPVPETPIQDLDSQAVKRAKAGNIEAWSQLYQRHFGQIFRHLSYLTGDVHAAEDLVQEVFSSALVSLQKFDERSRFLTWLHGIANNIVRKHWRSGKRRANAHRRFEQQPLSHSSERDPEGVQLQQERAEALQLAMEELPSNLREAFVLIELCELKPHEAAMQLGISANNVAVRASRARTKIRAYLIKNGWISQEREVPQ